MINRLTAVSPSGIVRRYSHFGSTRRTLENSCLYSEELGIDLTTGRDRSIFAGSLPASYSLPTSLKRQRRTPIEVSCGAASPLRKTFQPPAGISWSTRSCEKVVMCGVAVESLRRFCATARCSYDGKLLPLQWRRATRKPESKGCSPAASGRSP